MKKNYMSPETEIFTVTIPSLLVDSPGTPDAPVDPENPPVDPGEIESRRRKDVWDDEDEFEDEDDGKW